MSSCNHRPLPLSNTFKIYLSIWILNKKAQNVYGRIYFTISDFCSSKTPLFHILNFCTPVSVQKRKRLESSWRHIFSKCSWKSKIRPGPPIMRQLGWKPPGICVWDDDMYTVVSIYENWSFFHDSIAVVLFCEVHLKFAFHPRYIFKVTIKSQKLKSLKIRKIGKIILDGKTNIYNLLVECMHNYKAVQMAVGRWSGLSRHVPCCVLKAAEAERVRLKVNGKPGPESRVH